MYLGATVVRICRVKGMGEGLSKEPGCTWFFPSSQTSQEQRMIVPSQLSCQLWGGGGWEGMLGLSLWEGSKEKTENLDKRTNCVLGGQLQHKDLPRRSIPRRQAGSRPSLQDSRGCLG